MKPLRIGLIGARGRMGRAIAEAAGQDPRFEIAPAAEIAATIAAADVVIDFSHAEMTAEVASACGRDAKPLVLGTTGHSATQLEMINAAARAVPIVFAPNFSVGVNTLFWLAAKTAALLGSEFDLEIVEMHHRLKKDAPSGTAKRLAEILADARALDPATSVTHGRVGMPGERPPAQIGMHAVRGGDMVGEHTVIFAGEGERVELVHRASSRATFAVGALRAAVWLSGRPAGLYTMQDVLGLPR